MDFKSLSCSSFFLLLSTFYLTLFLAQAARNNPPPKQNNYHYHVVNITSLRPKSYCESHNPGSAFGSEKIKLASRNGPCAPHNPAKTIPFSESEELIQTEKPNAGYMEYFVTIGLGNPKTEFVLLVDTGSDATWVRCKPCIKGCGHNNLFDPSKSSTYVDGSDDFNSSYGDKSTAKGHWGSDTLTIDESHVVENFKFGCARAVKDTDDHDGLLGLGRGALSLSSQGGSKFEKFSYCLPKSDSQIGYLLFGNDADKKSSSSNPQFTPLVSPPANLPKIYQGQSYYFVELIGMSVGGKELEVDSSVFTSRGTIIDSGTSITQLPREVYSALATAFHQSMASKYPSAKSNNKKKICYNVEGFDISKISVPDVTFRFKGGVDVALKSSGIIMIQKSEPNLVCLGFDENKTREQVTIIGNHQQRQMGMFFDLQGKRVGFGTNNCDE